MAGHENVALRASTALAAPRSLSETRRQMEKALLRVLRMS
jgi:hypothetical protein